MRRGAFGALYLAAAVTASSGGSARRLATVDASRLPKLYSVVDTRAGAAGKDMVASEFRLLENGVAGGVADAAVKFRDTGMGMAVIVAIDASRSMNGEPLNAVRQGLAQLVTRKRDKDRVTVMTFADDVRWETRWDDGPSAVQKALRAISARGNRTRIYDALGAAMDELGAQAHEDAAFPARTCILLLSDGHDEGSRTRLNEITDRLQASRVRLDAVGLARSPLWLRNLGLLSDAGFGAFQTARTSAELSALLARGVDSLLDLPVLTFDNVDVARNGASHRIGVEHLPSHWRDELTVTVPERKTDRRLLLLTAGAGALLLIVLSAWTIGRRRRRRPSAVSLSTASPAPSALPTASAARVRSETVFESATRPLPQPPSSPPPSPALSSPLPERRSTVFAQPDGGPSSLRVTAGPHSGERAALPEGDFWIGSSSNNDLCLAADSAVSGNHAAIRSLDGFLRLFDNGSLNNTFVNGQPVGREAVLLRAGDKIRLGQSEIAVEI